MTVSSPIPGDRKPPPESLSLDKGWAKLRENEVHDQSMLKSVRNVIREISVRNVIREISGKSPTYLATNRTLPTGTRCWRNFWYCTSSTSLLSTALFPPILLEIGNQSNLKVHPGIIYFWDENGGLFPILGVRMGWEYVTPIWKAMEV